MAGSLTANEASRVVPNVARILDGRLAAAFSLVVSESLLAECHAVVVRPKLRKLHGLTVAKVEAILTDLAQNAIVLAPVGASPAPDPGNPLLRALLAARADLLLVTGDKPLLRDAGMRARGMSPSTFVAATGQPAGSNPAFHF